MNQRVRRAIDHDGGQTSVSSSRTGSRQMQAQQEISSNDRGDGRGDDRSHDKSDGRGDDRSHDKSDGRGDDRSHDRSDGRGDDRSDVWGDDMDEGVNEEPSVMVNGRIQLQRNPYTGKIIVFSKIARVITSSFHLVPNITGFTWALTPDTVKALYFGEFEKTFYCPSDWESEVKNVWSTKARERYSGYINDLKTMYFSGRPKPIYVPNELWSGLIAYWKIPAVIKKSDAARKARMSEPDGPGTGISKQRGGSVSVEEKALKMAAERGVSVRDCMYESFHSLHTYEDGSYTYKRAADIDAKVKAIAATKGDNPNLSKISIDDVLGGKLDKKKRMIGAGNFAKRLICNNSTLNPSVGLDPSILDQIRDQMQQEVMAKMQQEFLKQGLELKEMMKQFMFKEPQQSSHTPAADDDDDDDATS